MNTIQFIPKEFHKVKLGYYQEKERDAPYYFESWDNGVSYYLRCYSKYGKLSVSSSGCCINNTDIPTEESFQKIRDFNTWFNNEVDYNQMYWNN